MTRPPPRPERRKESRIAPKGAVTLAFGDTFLQARIGNLTRRGLFASTRLSVPEELLAHKAVIQLRLDGEGSWLEAHGHVLRIEADGIAFALDDVSSALGAVIDEMSSQSHVHGRTLSVVVIDGDGPRRMAMVEGFRVAGCTVLAVSTPLEAIVRLGASSFEPALVAIGDTVTGSADELRAFVLRNHPHTKLVAVGMDASSELTSAWLSADDSASDLPARVLQVLGRPRRS